MKLTFSKIVEFIKTYHVKVVVVIVPIGAILILAIMITYNESNHFCESCHFHKGTYIYLDKNRPVHKNIDQGGFTCIRCHTNKLVQVIYARNLKKYQQQIQLIGNLQAKEFVNPKNTYTTEQCLNCHPDRLEVVERDPYLIQDDRLRKIGLRFNKRLHYRYELLQDEDKNRFNELSKKSSRTDDEENELELLEKINSGNCAQCHIQKKLTDGKLTIDKQVNFIARNPISCAGCHEEALLSTHPGKPMSPPSKQVCQKCHHGQIHGKFMIFKADCIEGKEIEHCIKCHPLYNSLAKVK